MEQQLEMVNPSYEPAPEEEEILELMLAGRDEGEPWGHTTPAHVRESTSVEKGNESYHLRQLKSAGWIEKVARGFYRFVDDPREGNDE